MFNKSLLVVLILGMLTTPCFAGELEEAKLKMTNIQLEFQLTQERQKVLQYQARELQVVISKLELQAKEEKQKEVTIPSKKESSKNKK